MAALLQTHPLLALFLVVGLGAALGAIRFGPLRFGAAGALFVGLVLSASVPETAGENMRIVQQIGLAFFVYTVGISAGATFFQDLRKQTGLLASCAAVCLTGAVLALAGGRVLGLGEGLTTGLYTGALTAAPALDAATRVTGDPQAAVGYAFGYPIGVVVGILVVTMTVTRRWAGARDTPSLAGENLETVTVLVADTINMRQIAAWREQRIRMSYLRRGDRTRVVAPGEDLLAGDHVLMVGDAASVEEAARDVGEILGHRLEDDRSDVAFERILVSNPDVAGRSVSQLNVTKRFGATITRVRRGDLDLLARDDLDLQLGDHVAVVVPIEELDAVSDWLGDSERRVAEVDAMAFGIGMVLGMLLGIVSFPMPGGSSFQLGSAAGPLIVGMVLGALRRTGPLVWTLPRPRTSRSARSGSCSSWLPWGSTRARRWRRCSKGVKGAGRRSSPSSSSPCAAPPRPWPGASWACPPRAPPGEWPGSSASPPCSRRPRRASWTSASKRPTRPFSRSPSS